MYTFMDITIQTYQGFSEELLDIMSSLEGKIFEDPYTREKLERESRAKHQLQGLVAFHGSEPCGFKIGYEMTARLFYSWNGGVIPEYRSNGIAQSLMRKQHDLARELGYRAVRTYTENRYRDMLLLNIKADFDIIGVFSERDSTKTIIVLEKSL